MRVNAVRCLVFGLLTQLLLRGVKVEFSDIQLPELLSLLASLLLLVGLDWIRRLFSLLFNLGH